MYEATVPAPGPEVCSLENYLALPDYSMDERIAAARAKLGKTTVLLGHHYQRDEVIRFADFTGDSYKLSKVASETEADFLIFCGVHFMAESADVLGRPDIPGSPASRSSCPTSTPAVRWRTWPRSARSRIAGTR